MGMRSCSVFAHRPLAVDHMPPPAVGLRAPVVVGVMANPPFPVRTFAAKKKGGKKGKGGKGGAKGAANIRDDASILELAPLRANFQGAITALEKELGGLRGGGTSATMLDHIEVSNGCTRMYGGMWAFSYSDRAPLSLSSLSSPSPPSPPG